MTMLLQSATRTFLKSVLPYCICIADLSTRMDTTSGNYISLVASIKIYPFFAHTIVFQSVTYFSINHDVFDPYNSWLQNF
jgi:hypothetical protein